VIISYYYLYIIILVFKRKLIIYYYTCVWWCLDYLFTRLMLILSSMNIDRRKTIQIYGKIWFQWTLINSWWKEIGKISCHFIYLSNYLNKFFVDLLIIQMRVFLEITECSMNVQFCDACYTSLHLFNNGGIILVWRFWLFSVVDWYS